jgi:hypothetical protein
MEQNMNNLNQRSADVKIQYLTIRAITGETSMIGGYANATKFPLKSGNRLHLLNTYGMSDEATKAFLTDHRKEYWRMQIGMLNMGHENFNEAHRQFLTDDLVTIRYYCWHDEKYFMQFGIVTDERIPKEWLAIKSGGMGYGKAEYRKIVQDDMETVFKDISNREF